MTDVSGNGDQHVDIELIGDDIVALVEWCMLTAVERWSGHLIPFAAGLTLDGELVEFTTPDVHAGTPEANAIIDLTAALRPHRSELRAAAITYRIDHDADNDAIEVSLEHRGGVARLIRRPFPKDASALELGALESKDAPGAILFEKPRAG
ncbi:MAG TPA: hypothetical protein VNT53_07955 [Pseudolysinimonas sp.]|nr:hypothetical protein [Pseudolysinimonas sp.]